MKQEADPSEVILIEWWDLNKFSQVLCSSSKQRDMKRRCSQLQINPYPKMLVSVPQQSTVTNAGSWIIWIGDRSLCYALSSSRSIRWQGKPWNRQMLYISRANIPHTTMRSFTNSWLLTSGSIVNQLFRAGSRAHPTSKILSCCGTGILPVLNNSAGSRAHPTSKILSCCGTGILPVLNNSDREWVITDRPFV